MSGDHLDTSDSESLALHIRCTKIGLNIVKVVNDLLQQAFQSCFSVEVFLKNKTIPLLLLTMAVIVIATCIALMHQILLQQNNKTINSVKEKKYDFYCFSTMSLSLYRLGCLERGV